MTKDDWSDSTLLLVGHGSTVNADSAVPTYLHAQELRRRGAFAEVLECFWKQEPLIKSVLPGVKARRVFVVPLFISEGYFTEEAIPRELELRAADQASFPRVQARGPQTLHYCRPIGTHPRMADVILARAREAVASADGGASPDPRETAIFVAGHGTERNANSRTAIVDQVERIRALRLYGDAHAVFMEEPPRIGDCYQLSPQRNFVVVPFFISDGLHSHEHIPVMLGEPEAEVQRRLKSGEATWRNPTEKHGRHVWYSRGVGTEPVVTEIILERVREAEKGEREDEKTGQREGKN